MKTKSKRFLNLATLCLTLLGTTLLTTQPVKAEGVQYSLESGVSTDSSEQSSSTGQTGENAEEVQQQTTGNEDTLNEDTIKEEYMALFGLDDDKDLQDHLQEPENEGYYKGYVDGYRKGFKGEKRIDRGDIKVPENIKCKDEYKDGHEGGFEAGRSKTYPVTAFLEEVWGFFTRIFKSWFSSGTNSQ
ncbi:hypothetical membrane associated protein [Streptococcus pyogenes]|uniref:hypothetical protein n=1 Tax=Streptococcus pyogenes TaxID=1314 RepID=UPI00109C7572|nr:hypothetical protein [Streptococcus pyogenes]VGT85493.1 hypothetical membrane associated protein [Streptococcus pyogenes]